MDLSLSQSGDKTIENVNQNLTEFEGRILACAKKACQEVRKKNPKLPDINGQESTSFAMVAGGWVRDKIINKPSKDIDIIVAQGCISDFLQAFRKEMEALKVDLAKAGFSITTKEQKTPLQAGHCKGSFVFQFDILVENIETNSVEEHIDLDFRELDYGINALVEDLKTRDFTVNGLYYDLVQEMTIDKCGGIHDIRMKEIRCINSFEITFADVSRFMRGIRFCITKGFKLEPQLEEYFVKRAGPALHSIGKDVWNVTKELDKMIKEREKLPEVVVRLARLGMFIGQPPQSEEDLEFCRIVVQKYVNSLPKTPASSPITNMMFIPNGRYTEGQVRNLVIGFCLVRQAEAEGNLFKQGKPISSAGSWKIGLQTILKILVIDISFRKRTKIASWMTKHILTITPN